MSSVLTKIFLERVLSLPLERAIQKIKLNPELESKHIEIVFIDSLNKEYFETQNKGDQNFLRVVNIKLEDEKIKIFVAYELTELIERKGKRNAKN